MESPENQKQEPQPTAEETNSETIFMSREDMERELEDGEAGDVGTSPGGEKSADELQREVNELQDRFLRMQAELDNIRKRSRREVEEAHRYGSLALGASLLPVLDNLSRALAAGGTTSAEDLHTGVEMVAQQFEQALEQHAIKRIATVGEMFDPSLHDAVQMAPSEEHEPMTILQELEAGFQLHDRVVRPAKVIVAQKAPEKSSDE